MPKPGDSEARLVFSEPRVLGINCRQFSFRHAAFVAAEKLRNRRHLRRWIAQAQLAHAAENWVACRGTVTTVDKASTKTEPAEHIYVLDDRIRQFYQWSGERKLLSIIPTTSYSDDKILWRSDKLDSQGTAWSGSLDRKSMAVRIDRIDRDSSRMTFAEKCQPSQALNEPALASAGTESRPSIQ